MSKGIILDLDETLIHSVILPTIDPNLKAISDFHFQLDKDQYYVFKRPGLDEFIKLVFKEFNYVGFWTMGIASYARQILRHILKLSQAESDKLIFIFTRNKGCRDNSGYYKPLESVWSFTSKFTPKNTIMIDNSPWVFKKNPKNGIVCPDYDKNNLYIDTYLPWLSEHIKTTLPQTTPLKFVERINLLTKQKLNQV